MSPVPSFEGEENLQVGSDVIENFWLPSIMMGLGIAIDVAVATLARFRDPSLTFRSWTLPVAIAHIVLPAIGYYTWWGLGSAFGYLTIPLGIAAFSMISIFIYEAFCDWIGSEPRVSLDSLLRPILARIAPDSTGRAATILAVSLDALWSGPAKSAQAISGNWHWTLVIVSFFIAGGVVAIVAELSLLVAKWLGRISFREVATMARFLVLGKFSEAAILFGFGVLSLWNAFGLWIGLGSLFESILISASMLIPIFIYHHRKLVDIQIDELEPDAAVATTGAVPH